MLVRIELEIVYVHGRMDMKSPEIPPAAPHPHIYGFTSRTLPCVQPTASHVHTVSQRTQTHTHTHVTFSSTKGK